MTTQKRAKVGGEVGVNGDFYEGGKFLPSTEKPKGKPHKRGTGKQEIEPYKWEIAPEGKRSLYRQLAGIHCKLIDGKMVLATNDQILNYTGQTIEQVKNMVELYNAGQRWI